MIKERVDLKKVDVRLAVSDAPVGDLPVHIKCREHEDSTASLAVYVDHLHCFGCGFHMKRRMDSLAYLLGLFEWFLGDEGDRMYKIKSTEAIEVAHKYTSDAVDAYRERAGLEANTNPLPNSLAVAYADFLGGYRENRMRWLVEQRGITPYTIGKFCLGHDGTRFTIPFFSPGGLRTIRFRRDDQYGIENFEGREIPKYSGVQGRNASGAYLYPEWLVASQKEHHVVAVESELCVVRLRQEGIPAVCTFSGAGAMKHLPKLLEPYSRISYIFIAADMDEAGDVGRDELWKVAEEEGFILKKLRWNSEWGKDPTELYQNGHSLEEVGYER